MLLAGDIGGTKTNLAIFSPQSGQRAPLVEATFPSAQYPSLETLAGEFLSTVKVPVTRASFGVAGPVVAGQARITNLPWIMDEVQLAQALRLSSVRLLNDLEAIANAVPVLEPADLLTLNAGEHTPNGALAVIAPGTGLGEAFLAHDGTRYHAFPCEGGHTDFAPADDLQLELLRYLRQRYDHVSYERVCSGLGLPNIYAFLKESGYAPEPPWLGAQLAAASDHAPIIVNAAMDTQRPCALCRLTLETFVAILGAEAGNLALKVLSTGGVYLGGGIPPRILPLLQQEPFLRAFQHKGRFAALLSRMPVHVILNPKVALLGAARHGLERLRQ